MDDVITSSQSLLRKLWLEAALRLDGPRGRIQTRHDDLLSRRLGRGHEHDIGDAHALNAALGQVASVMRADVDADDVTTLLLGES